MAVVSGTATTIRRSQPARSRASAASSCFGRTRRRLRGDHGRRAVAELLDDLEEALGGDGARRGVNRRAAGREVDDRVQHARLAAEGALHPGGARPAVHPGDVELVHPAPVALAGRGGAAGRRPLSGGDRTHRHPISARRATAPKDVTPARGASPSTSQQKIGPPFGGPEVAEAVRPQAPDTHIDRNRPLTGPTVTTAPDGSSVAAMNPQRMMVAPACEPSGLCSAEGVGIEPLEG